jgi:hypothetical protein
MSCICDLCKKKLKEDTKVMFFKTSENHICEDCIKTCQTIMSDKTMDDNKVVYLNEYKDMLEERKHR